MFYRGLEKFIVKNYDLHVVSDYASREIGYGRFGRKYCLHLKQSAGLTGLCPVKTKMDRITS
jgi:hypothetical protein